MLGRLDASSHPRPSFMLLDIAVTRPTTPRANVNAPKTITSENRLMLGQMMITTPRAIERTPLMPSAHLTFFSCVPAICCASANKELIDVLRRVVDRSTVAAGGL